MDNISLRVGQTYQPVTVHIDGLAMTEQVRRRLNIHYDDIVAKHKDVNGWHYDVDKWHAEVKVLKAASDTNARNAAQSATESKTAETASKRGASESVIAKDEAVKAQTDSKALGVKFTKALADAEKAAAGAKASEKTSVTKAGESSDSASQAADSTRAAKNAQTASEAGQAGSEAAEARAEKWADNGEDVAVVAGKYSARHWSVKAAASATASALSASSSEQSSQRSETKSSEASSAAAAAKQSEVAAGASETAAKTSENKARRWASDPLNTLVESDEYSAKHWALKAETFAQTVSSALLFKGEWDASTGAHPTDPADNHPEFYIVTKAGQVSGVDYSVGDNIVWSPTKKLWFRIDNSDRQITSELTVDSETISLSAKAGKLLNDIKLSRSGGNVSGSLNYLPDTGTVLQLDGKPLLTRTTAAGAIGLGAAESVVIGSGASRHSLTSFIDPAVENLYLASDLDIQLLTNMQSGGGARKTFGFGKDGSFTAPGPVSDATGRCYSVGHPPPWTAVSGKPDFDSLYVGLNGTAKNAGMLGNLPPERYAIRRSVTATVPVGSSGEWVHVADVSGGGRALARFKLMEDASAQHGYVEFYAGITFGRDAQLNVVASGGYYQTGLLAQIRIVRDGDDPDYGNHQLQVFVAGNSHLTVYLYEDDPPHNQWQLLDLTGRGLEAGYREEVAINLQQAFEGLATTGEVYARGTNPCFHKGNINTAVLPAYARNEDSLSTLTDKLAARNNLEIISKLEQPVYNLMRDSGTMSDVYKQDEPLRAGSTINFEPDIGFMGPYNGASWASAGAFKHGQTPTLEPVIALLSALESHGREAGYHRYGIPFCLGRLTVGDGVLSPRSDGTRNHYLAMFSQSGFGIVNHTGRTTFACWARVREGEMLLVPGSTYINKELITGIRVMKPADGWFHYLVTTRPTGGYDSTMPYIYSIEGSLLDFALPVIFPGRIIGFMHLCPVVAPLNPYRNPAA